MAGDRAEAWYLLGDHLYHYGRILEVHDSPRRALDHFKRAAELDTSYVVALLHAISLAETLGDTAFARRAPQLRLAADTARFWLLPHQWHRPSYLALRDAAEPSLRAQVSEVRGELRRLEGQSVGR